MAPLGRFLCKNEDLRSDSRNPHKKAVMAVRICDPSAGDRDRAQREILEACRPAGLSERVDVSFSEKPVSKIREVTGKLTQC